MRFKNIGISVFSFYFLLQTQFCWNVAHMKFQNLFKKLFLTPKAAKKYIKGFAAVTVIRCEELQWYLVRSCSDTLRRVAGIGCEELRKRYFIRITLLKACYVSFNGG